MYFRKDPLLNPKKATDLDQANPLQESKQLHK